MIDLFYAQFLISTIFTFEIFITTIDVITFLNLLMLMLFV